jgi:Holliday junction resolvase
VKRLAASRAPRAVRALRGLCIARAPRLFARLCTPDDRELGEWGEEIAARHLQARGWRILARRLRTACAEVDLVALDRRTLVCVEVKTARLEPIPLPRGAGAPRDVLELVRWRPGARCDARRIARLSRAARLLARERAAGAHGRADDDAARSDRRRARPRQDTRVDLIEVFWLEPARGARVVHHPGVRWTSR